MLIVTLLAHLRMREFEYKLGHAYYMGLFVKKHPFKAAKWSTRAARRGHPRAQVLLSNFYVAGFGIDQDYAKAFFWAKAAAAQGDPIGKHTLAWCYEQGIGVEFSQELAFQCYLGAAKEGVANAQWAIAAYLYNGDVMPKDLQMALQWCRLAVKNGADSPAQELLNSIELELSSVGRS